MKEYKSIKEIQYTNDVFSMECSVVSLISNGDKGSRSPIVATLQCEASGEFLRCVSWNFDILDALKNMSKPDSTTVAIFEFLATKYKDQPSVRIGKIIDFLTKKSTVKASTPKADYKNEITELINTVKDPVCEVLLREGILNNQKYFKWPAARSVHHNYPGGLAKHSYSVALRCKNVYENFENKSLINYDVLITGALLHDIGKLQEYTENGEISFYGEFSTHLVMGSEIIDYLAGVNHISKSDYRIINLKHIINSHHGVKEYGSPIEPKTIEALIISLEDNSDAKLETLRAGLSITNPSTFTEPFRTLENVRFFRKGNDGKTNSN